MSRGLHRYLAATASATFLLIIAGGLVTSTDAGLSVPDWPNTYGRFMFAFPIEDMVGGIFYEHSHRMIASVVGFLTVIAAIWISRRDERRWVRGLGWSALGAVVAQGLLGGLTVLLLLPTAVSVAHATLAQTFFAIMATLAFVTSPWWRRTNPLRAQRGADGGVVRLAIASAGIVYVQLILGAIMRHMQAGLAVPDVPLAYGQIVPSLSPEALARYNDILLKSDIRIAADGPITAGQVLIHMLHRGWALVTAGTLLVLAVKLYRLRRTDARLGFLGIALPLLVAVQITLGVLTVTSLRAVDVTTAHVAVGALVLITTVLGALHAVRLFGLPERGPALVRAQGAAA